MLQVIAAVLAQSCLGAVLQPDFADLGRGLAETTAGALLAGCLLFLRAVVLLLPVSTLAAARKRA